MKNLKENNITVIDPFTFICEMLPYMAEQEDKIIRLTVGKQILEALSELSKKY